MTGKHLIVFFDGHCGLCNGFVDLILRSDRHDRLRFSALQSDFARKTLPPEHIEDLQSLVIYKEGQIKTKSDGVFEVCKELGGIFSVFLIFQILPKKFKDGIYDWVARHRFSMFGRSETCRIPTAQERDKFL